MKLAIARTFCALILLFAAVGYAAAGTVTGVVRNGTSGKPAAGVPVTLLQLQGGMETVADSKSDAQGRYSLTHAGIGQQPMLIRVNYRGVLFHESLPPGRNTADVEVFEPTTDPETLQMVTRLIALQPNGSTLLVGEEYTIQNSSNPPLAFYQADGTFEFDLPESGDLAQVSAWGPSGMPVVQGTIDRGKRRYAIAFAFRPGKSGVRISYQIPYTSNRAALHLTSQYAAQSVLVMAPPAMQITGAGFQAAGSEQGWSVYAHDAVPSGTPIELAVSGTGPRPSAGDSGEQQGGGGRNSGIPVQALPNRLDNLKWILLGGFAAVFFLGALYLWRRPVSASAGPAAPDLQVPPGKRAMSAKPLRAAVPPASPVKTVEEIQREVSYSLDELKDTLFRLELRRQAGTISEEDYQRERGRAEKILRDLVKG